MCRKNKIFLLSLCFLIAACTTTKYVEVPIETVKTNYITQILKDTLIIRDSIDRWLKNDTVFIHKYKYLYKTIYQKDTIFITDTILNVVYQDKIITVNELKDWLKLFMYIGIFTILLIILIVFTKFKL